LSISFEKNEFQCFGCGKKGNQLDLFMAATRLPLFDAAIELCTRLGIESPPRT
jgi:DNA primase